MASRYEGKIKVVNLDGLCFPADPETLDALGCGSYDPYPWDEPGAVEIIDSIQWNLRRSEQRGAPHADT